jgi:hypothetical protein
MFRFSSYVRINVIIHINLTYEVRERLAQRDCLEQERLMSERRDVFHGYVTQEIQCGCCAKEQLLDEDQVGQNM